MWSKTIFINIRRFCSGVRLKPKNEAFCLSDIFNGNGSNSSVASTGTTGLFNVSELSSPHGFEEQQRACIARSEELVQEALSKNRTRKMVEIFDEMSNLLCRVADLAEFIRLAHPLPQFNKAAEKTCIAVSEIVEKLNTNRRLFDNLKKSVHEGDIVATTESDDLVSELFLYDFEQNGIHLSEELRHKVMMLNNKILNLGQGFVSGCDSPRIVKRSSIPQDIQNLFTCTGDNIIVNGLYVDSSNPVLREVAYKIYYHPDEHQEILLRQLVESRYDLARICGFNSYSERVLRGGIVEKTENVMNFLETTSNSIREFSEDDFHKMNRMKSGENVNNKELAIWDVPYYIQKAKREWFKVNQEKFCPYFSLGTCMDGLNIIFKNLYGIILVNSPLLKGEAWSNNVYKLAVEHETEGTLGYIYCDFYERPGKQNQDCHFTIRGGKEMIDGSYQIPIAVLMLNFRAPTWGTPPLLSPHNVDNLFHEMGHAMHSMLARTKYQHVTGTRCSTDFAEVPSVLMEYFASDTRILKLFAKHYETNTPLPEDMLQRLCVSKRAFIACETNMQIFYSILDQLLHGENPSLLRDNKVLMELQEKYYGLRHVHNTAWHHRFSHLVGYGAKYYSYLVSRSVAHSIWQNYFQLDPLNRQNGDRYRRECLAYGGGKNPKKLVVDFLKMEPSPKILSESLITEISENHEAVERFCKEHKVF